MARTKSQNKGKYWKDYQKERQRISRQLKRMKDRGYYWDKDILPNIPKRITQASVNRLKKIKSDDIYRKAMYLDRETGEFMIGLKGRKLERHRSAMAGAETRRKAREFYEYNDRGFTPPEATISISMDSVFITNYRLSLNPWNLRVQDKVNRWIDELIARFGVHDVAMMIVNGQEAGVMFTRKEAYDNESLKNYMAEMIDFLPEAGDFTKDALNKEFEEMLFQDEDFGDRMK